MSMDKELRMKKRAEEIYAKLVEERDRARAEAIRAKEALGRQKEETEKWKRKAFHEQNRADFANATFNEISAESDRVIRRSYEAIKNEKKLRIQNQKLQQHVDTLMNENKKLEKRLNEILGSDERKMLRKEIRGEIESDIDMFRKATE